MFEVKIKRSRSTLLQARRYRATIDEILWATPEVVMIRFSPNKKFQFLPGQFLSIYIPTDDPKHPLRRAYSFASSPERSRETGYELCIKYVEGGDGGRFLKSLKPGDEISFTAPYGDFHFVAPKETTQRLLFISTGTGVGPMKAMIESRDFSENRKSDSLFLFGCKTQKDLIVAKEAIEGVGLKFIPCFSRETPIDESHFQGRVTEYLRQMGSHWPWHRTEFYLCGSGEMISESLEILRGVYGVADDKIHFEAFLSAKKTKIAA